MHAASSLTFDVPAGCTRFDSVIGIDEEVGSRGSVTFEVWADGTRLVSSGSINGALGPRTITADLAGRHQLRLVVTDGGNGTGSDHADWANARLTCS
ncbi:MAG: glycoside hydrolase family 2 [Actinomycetia bacterium]|nr:glycoside hydrolase family 2 [Actinomycetes bacterium]